jgi:hypothetical protein
MAGGGVGEAALLGAVMGGGSAALTGGDPLKGAMMGGLTGGAGGFLSQGIASLAAPTAAATLAPAAAAPVVAPVATLAAPEVIASNAVTSQVAPVISPAASALPNFPNSASVISPFKAQPGGIPAVLSNPTPQSLAGITGGGSNVFTGGNISPLTDAATGLPSKDETFSQGMKKFMDDPIASIKRNPLPAVGAAFAGANAGKKKLEEEEEYSGPLSRFKYNPDSYRPSGYADGGITSLGYGGYDQMVGEEPMYMSNMAAGGIADLGSYSDGGRMLKGPGDGMSDSIPANIAGKRPARLADGEFVIPADVVSHLGNGSTDAGAKQLYAMMAKVRKARTGRKAQGRKINPRQYMAA